MLAAAAGQCERKRGVGAHLLPEMAGDGGYSPGLDQIIGSQAATEPFSHPGQAGPARTAGR